MSKMIKVAKLGSAIKEVFLDDTATIADCIRASEFSVDSMDVRLCGVTVSNLNDVPSDGAVISLIPQIKGGLDC